MHPHSSQSHRSPRRCRETSSRRSNLPSKTCLLLSAALFTKTGGERASGKTSGKAAGERCSAQAPLGGGSSLQAQPKQGLLSGVPAAMGWVLLSQATKGAPLLFLGSPASIRILGFGWEERGRRSEP